MTSFVPAFVNSKFRGTLVSKIMPNTRNTEISLEHIHFIDKIKLILYPSPEFFTTGRRGGKYTSASVISEKRGT